MASKIKYIPEVKYDVTMFRKLTNILGNEISELSRPCYFPKFAQYMEDIKHELGVDDKMIAEFKKQNISSLYSSFRLINEPQTILLIIPLIYFSKTKKTEMAKLFFLLIALKFQSSLLHKHFKEYCNPEMYLLALENISHKHLYKIKSGIPNTVQYLCNEEFKKWQNIIASDKFTDEHLMKMLYAIRHRLSQSVKSFAEAYYQIAKDKNIKLSKSEETTEQDRVDHILDKITMLICTYGNVDQVAMNKAISYSGIRKEYGISIVSEISTTDNRDSIKFILLLFHRIMNLKSICVENSRISLIRKVNSGVKIQNYSPKEQILNMMNTLPSGYSYRSIFDDQKCMFVCQYLTLYLRGRIC